MVNRSVESNPSLLEFGVFLNNRTLNGFDMRDALVWFLSACFSSRCDAVCREFREGQIINS